LKKGCFLKFIIIFTILVGVILYIVQNKFEEYFVRPGKKIVLSVLVSKWDKQLNYVKPGVEKDSLRILLENYISKTNPEENDFDNKTDKIIKQLAFVFNDSTVNADELTKIKETLSKALNNAK